MRWAPLPPVLKSPRGMRFQEHGTEPGLIACVLADAAALDRKVPFPARVVAHGEYSRRGRRFLTRAASAFLFVLFHQIMPMAGNPPRAKGPERPSQALHVLRLLLFRDCLAPAGVVEITFRGNSGRDWLA